MRDESDNPTTQMSGQDDTFQSYDYTNKKLHLMYPDMHGDMYRILIDFSKVVLVWLNDG